MKTLKIQVPDQLAKKVEALIEAGWFASEEELTRLALAEFLRRHHRPAQARTSGGAGGTPALPGKNGSSGYA